MNIWTGIGRLTKDPELRKTTGGTSVCNFTVAVNRRWKKEGQPDADFINCLSFGQTAEFVTTYLAKGSLIAIDGRIQTGSYENAEGKRVYTTEIVVNSVETLEKKGDTVREEEEENYEDYATPEDKPILDISSELNINSSDLPF